MLLLVGISAACWHVPAPVVVRTVAGERLGTGMSFYMLGGELARGIGPSVILAAVSLWGMDGTYRMIPVGLAASVLLWVKLKNIRVRVSPQGKNAARGFLEMVVRLRRLFITMAGISFGRVIVTRALTVFLPTYLTSTGSSLWLSGISLSVLEFAGAAGTFVGGAVSDKIGRRRMLLIGAISTPLLMALFLLSGGIWVLLVLILLGLFSFTGTPVALALVQEHAGDSPAAANGTYMTLNFLTGALAAFLAGLMRDWVGLKTAFWLCAVLSLIGLPCVFLLLEKEHPRRSMREDAGCH